MLWANDPDPAATLSIQAQIELLLSLAGDPSRSATGEVDYCDPTTAGHRR